MAAGDNTSIQTAIYQLRYETGDSQANLDRVNRAAQQNVAVTGQMEVTQERATRATRGAASAMDKLIGRLDPRVRAEQRLQEALATVNRLEQEGLSTSAQRTQAVDAATKQYEQAIQRINRREGSNLQGTFIGAGDAAELSAFQIQNLSFQMQDLGQAVATGQPLFRSFIQQGSQIAQVYGPGVGVGAALKSTGTALKTFLLNPLNLAVLAIAGAVAGGQKLFQWLLRSKDETEETGESVDRLSDALKLLEDGFDATSGAVQRYGRAITQVAGFELERVIRDSARGLRDQRRDLLGGEIFTRPEAEFTRQGQLLQTFAPEFLSAESLEGIETAQGEVNALWRLLREFLGDMEDPEAILAFREALSQMANEGSEGLQQLADQVLDATDEMTGFAEETIRAQAAARVLAGIGDEEDIAISGLDIRSLDENIAALQDYVPTLEEANQQQRDLAEAGDILSAALFQLDSRVNAGLITNEEYIEKWKAVSAVFDDAKRAITGFYDEFDNANEIAAEFIEQAEAIGQTALERQLASIEREAGEAQDAIESLLSRKDLTAGERTGLEALLIDVESAKVALINEAKRGGDEAVDVIGQLDAALTRLRQGWDDASNAVMEYGRDVSAEVGTQVLAAIEDVNDAIKDQLALIANGEFTGFDRATMEPLLESLPTAEFQQFQGIYSSFLQDIVAGTASVADFRREVSEMAAEGSPAARDLAQKVLELTDELVGLENIAYAASTALRVLAGGASSAAVQIAGLTGQVITLEGHMATLVNFIPSLAAAARVQGELTEATTAHAEAIEEANARQRIGDIGMGERNSLIAEANALLEQAVFNIEGTADAFESANEAADRFVSQGQHAGLEGVELRIAQIRDRADEARNGINAMLAEPEKLLAGQEEAFRTQLDLINASEAAQIAAAQAAGGGGGGGGAAGATEDWTSAIREQIEALREQITLVGASVFETERAGAEAQLMEALIEQAGEAGIEITEELIQVVRALAEEYASLNEELQVTQTLSDLAFERQQILRSPVEQNVASTLRDIYGDEYLNHMDGAIARQMRLNSLLTSAKDAALGFVETLINGLINGANMLDTLSSALGNLAQQMASGALRALFSGRFILAAVLGIGALLSGIFGGAIKKRREEQKALEEAQEAWAEMQDSLGDFIEQLNGGGGGSLTQALDEAVNRAMEFAQAAADAGESWEHINEALANFTQREVRRFIGGFGSMMDALSEGLGADSPAVEAAENVAEIGKALMDFITDTQTAVDASGGSQGAVDAARDASIGYAKSLLLLTPTLTEVEEQLRRVQGSAGALYHVLIDLGLSAEEAGKAVAEGVGNAVNQIRTNFVAELERQFNEGIGRGYFNEISDLIQSSALALNDALVLGVDPTLVGQAFVAQAQAIVDSSGLIGDAFDELINTFPELEGVVHEAAQGIEESIDTINRNARNILNFLNDLLAGPGTTVSPEQRLLNAQQIYLEQIALAQGGDSEAQAAITTFAQNYLDAAREFFASSEGFQTIFQQVQEDLLTLPDVLAATDPMLQALRESIAAIVGVELAIEETAEETQDIIDQVNANTGAALDLLDAVRQLQNSTRSISDDISQSIVDLGFLNQTIAFATGDEYFGPMIDLLSEIAEYTRLAITPAEEVEEDDRGFFQRLFDRIRENRERRRQEWEERFGDSPFGFSAGGLVTGGTPGRDSVAALLEPGEWVLTREQTARLRPYLEGNGGGFGGSLMAGSINAMNDNTRESFVELMRVVGASSEAQVAAMREEMGQLRTEVANLRRSLDNDQRRPARPGKRPAAA